MTFYNNMPNDNSKNILNEALQVDDMTEAERDEFLNRAGAVVIDAAVSRLLVSLSESEAAQLELYLGSHEHIEDIFGYLIKTYPTFEEYLAAEIVNLKNEALEIVT